MTTNFLSQKNKALFMIEGDIYFDYYVSLIDLAKHSIHLHTYIFEMDSFGTKVLNALNRAAQRGVSIWFLIDSVGSSQFSKKNEFELNTINIHFVRFNSPNLKWFFQWGRRLHHKILLVDDTKSIVGGINITRSGYGQKQKTQQLDFAIFLEGPIVEKIVRYTTEVFSKENSYSLSKKMSSQRRFKDHLNLLKLKISINDWVDRRSQITNYYVQIIKNSKKKITIVNPYFFPPRYIIKLLIKAAKRGVKVKLILPQMTDWPSHLLASEYLYKTLLKNGIDIFLWQKSILHGKLVTVDNQYLSIGSFNLNYTSLQQNLELNIDLASRDFVRNLDQVLHQLIKIGCQRLNLEEFENSSNLRIKVLRFICFVILNLISYFSHLLLYQEVQNQSSFFKVLNKLKIALFLMIILCIVFYALFILIHKFV